MHLNGIIPAHGEVLEKRKGKKNEKNLHAFPNSPTQANSMQAFHSVC